ncbi:MAG: DHH family phosphoesterase [bacterium]|nr:DHH family phosphoesterase [bacterium]
MPDEIIQSIIDKLKSSTKILVVLPVQAGGDDLSAALGLTSFLKKQNKEVTLVSPGNLNPSFNFLPGFKDTVSTIQITRNFIIDVDTRQTSIEELSYAQDQDKVSIFLKPKSGQFKKEDVSFRNTGVPFDIVVTMGVASPEHLGEFYNHATELFFEIPVVNIDHQAYNENFAQFNLVDLQASSSSEIVFDLINKINPSSIDADLATCLLTGIIVETNSFQHVRTTPQAFSKASELVSLGARQQDIINSLFKSKSFGLLKLWGRVLARLKQDPSISLVYSVASLTDIEKSESSLEDAGQIIKEMLTQLSFGKIFLFIKEVDAQNSDVYCATTAPISLSSVFAAYKPEVLGRSIKFSLPLGLNEAEEETVNILRREMSKD